MPARLEWDIDAPPVPTGSDAPERSSSPAPQPSPTGRRWQPLLIALYLVGLAVAAVIGFQLGRTTDEQARARAAIENALAVESLAYRERDAGLLRSTLDPDAPSRWTSARMAAFNEAGPGRYEVELRALELQSPTRAAVEVAVTRGDDQQVEERRYRQLSGGWYHTPSTPEGPTQR